MSPAVTDDNRTDDRAATEETPIAKRILIGEPLTNEELEGQLLPKRMALPIFASDALSSVAYAPQELLMILLIGGTAFAVKFSDGLTWIINESPKIMVFEQAIDFTSNGKKFDYFMITAGSRPSIVYSYGPGDIWYAYFNGSWTQEAFRTVTFAEMPTGALLAWLQANAVQQ